MKKYIFGAVKSQSSYIYGVYYSGWTWNQLLAENGKIDTGRTLWGKVYGTCKLEVEIEGIGSGIMWDQNYYNEFAYSSYQP